MKNNERVGVAVMAASVSAIVTSLIRSERRWVPRRPDRPRTLELLASNGPRRDERMPLLVIADREPDAHAVADDGDPAADGVGAAAPLGDGDRHVAPAERQPRVVKVSSIANAVSFMAIGAALTVLVLWATGGFQPQAAALTSATTGEEGAAAQPPSRPDLPLTAADVVIEDEEPVPPAEPVAPEEAVATPAPPVEVADPVQVEIGAIGVNARVIPLTIDEIGALQVPQDFSEAGWWTGGPEPGEIGPSVIVGHVDSFQGPAVFFRLEELAYDDAIVVTRGDGSAAVFAVRTTVRVDKSAFPTDLVYGETDDSQLRLVTCDGDFADGSYLGNLIITAELIDELPAPTTGLIS